MVAFSETIEVYVINVGIYSKLNEYMDIYPVHVPEVNVIHWPLSKVSQISFISTSLGPEITRQTVVKLHTEPSWVNGTQFYRSSWGHMTNKNGRHAPKW